MISSDPLVLWIVTWAVLGGTVTPLIYRRKGHNPLTGALIGTIVGALGNLVLLGPLWLLLPRSKSRATLTSATAFPIQSGLGNPLHRRPRTSSRTCLMLVFEIVVFVAAGSIFVDIYLPEPGTSQSQDFSHARPAPRGLTREDVLPTPTPDLRIPPQLITFPAAAMSARIVEAGRAGGTWETRHLGDSVGHLVGTSDLFDTGNIVLAGHVESYTGADGPFAYLFRAKIGDLVIISQGQREEHFEVTEIKIADPYDVNYVAQSGPHRLTLITCTEWNPKEKTYDGRLVVIAYPTVVTAQNTE